VRFAALVAAATHMPLDRLYDRRKKIELSQGAKKKVTKNKSQSNLIGGCECHATYVQVSNREERNPSLETWALVAALQNSA
jgi:hypothetical protein